MRGALLVIAALALAACSGAPVDGPSTSTDHDGGAATPRWMAEREPLPSCGTFGPEEYEDPATRKAALACLRTAFEEGRGAELVVRQLTDEGDPILRIWRVAGGHLDTMYDDREDALGSAAAGWTRCTEVAFEPYAPIGRSCEVLEGPANVLPDHG